MRVGRGKEVPAQEDTEEETTAPDMNMKVEEEGEEEAIAPKILVVGDTLAMADEESAQGPLVMGGLLQATPWLGSTNTLTFHFLDLIPLRQNPI